MKSVKSTIFLSDIAKKALLEADKIIELDEQKKNKLMLMARLETRHRLERQLAFDLKKAERDVATAKAAQEVLEKKQYEDRITNSLNTLIKDLMVLIESHPNEQGSRMLADAIHLYREKVVGNLSQLYTYLVSEYEFDYRICFLSCLRDNNFSCYDKLASKLNRESPGFLHGVGSLISSVVEDKIGCFSREKYRMLEYKVKSFCQVKEMDLTVRTEMFIR